MFRAVFYVEEDVLAVDGILPERLGDDFGLWSQSKVDTPDEFG